MGAASQWLSSAPAANAQKPPGAAKIMHYGLADEAPDGSRNVPIHPGIAPRLYRTASDANPRAPTGTFNDPSLTYGNGVVETRAFDLDYRLTTLADSGNTHLQNLTHGYDLGNNVVSVADGVTAANSQTFQYDALNRLTSAVGSYGALGYTYDHNGNRISERPYEHCHALSIGWPRHGDRPYL